MSFRNKFTTIQLFFAVVMLCAFIFVACEDEDDGDARYPYNEIISFTVPDVAGEELHAAIYNDTILLYWPPDVARPDSITPALVVSERATVRPASGDKVALKDGVVYTVTAEKGTTASYILKLIVNQPQPVMTTTFNSLEITSQSWNLGGFKYIIPDTVNTKLYFISSAGAEVRIPLQEARINTLVTRPITESLDTGRYKIKVITGIYTITSATPLVHAYVRPSILSFTPVSASVGDEVTITGKHFSTELTANVVKFGDVQAAVTAATATELKVTVPEGAVSGKITVMVNNFEGISATAFVVQAESNTVVSTYAGNGTSGYVDGPAAEAQLRPYGVILDVQGNMYVADYGNNCIRKITQGVVSTLAGSATQGAADGTGSAAQFRNPRSITMDAQGNLYVVDRNERIRKVTTDGVVTTLAGSSAGYVEGTGTNAKFNSPRGIVADSHGNLFVTDYNNFRIRKITPSGEVTTFAGSGALDYADGTGTAAKFGYMAGIAIDANDNLYVCDGSSRIRKITPQAVVTTYAGSGTEGYLDGPAAEAQFDGLTSITVDAQGNVYAGETANYRVRMITPAGEVSTYSGSGVSGFADGDGGTAMFKSPQGLTIDAAGTIYMADYSNYRIRKITLTAP